MAKNKDEETRIALSGVVKYPIEEVRKITAKKTITRWKTHIQNNKSGVKITIEGPERLDVAPGVEVSVILTQPQTTLKGGDEGE